MALGDFAEHFEGRYQDILSKSLVAKKIANMRLEKGLKFGDKAHRFKLDLSSVLVRDITNLTDRTVDAITDTDQTLDVDQKKGTTFPIAHWEDVQAGPLNPGLTAGREIGLKVATYVDASVLAETQNAFADFDTGNLTTTAATGVPITLSTTNVPQMITQAFAKLKANNAPMTSMCWVVDPYMASIIAQHPIGKDTSLGDNTFQNGLSGTLFGAQMYVSNNLTGEAVLGMATQPTAGDTVVINGVTFQFTAALSAAGDLHIGSNVDATRLNMSVALNDVGTAIAEATDTGYQVVSAADQATFNALRITATDSASADTLTIVAIGSGRLTLSETFTDGTDAWDTNFIHAYYGQKGAIDLVVQDEVKMKMREEPKQDTMNILNDVLYGVKTFTDGSQYFVDVLVTA